MDQLTLSAIARVAVTKQLLEITDQSAAIFTMINAEAKLLVAHSREDSFRPAYRGVLERIATVTTSDELFAEEDTTVTLRADTNQLLNLISVSAIPDRNLAPGEVSMHRWGNVLRTANGSRDSWTGRGDPEFERLSRILSDNGGPQPVASPIEMLILELDTVVTTMISCGINTDQTRLVRDVLRVQARETTPPLVFSATDINALSPHAWAWQGDVGQRRFFRDAIDGFISGLDEPASRKRYF
jgi:hypothetical protein